LPAKTIFAGKNYFCHPGFFPRKNRFFSTDWQKPANPGSETLVARLRVCRSVAARRR